MSKACGNLGEVMLQNVGLSPKLIILLAPMTLFGVLGLAAALLEHEADIVIANVVRASRTQPAHITTSTGQPASTPTAAATSS